MRAMVRTSRSLNPDNGPNFLPVDLKMTIAISRDGFRFSLRIFAWYRGHDRFKDLGFRAGRDYRSYMDKLENFQLKTTTFGQRRIAEINASRADALYRAIMKERGNRAGAYTRWCGRRDLNPHSQGEADFKSNWLDRKRSKTLLKPSLYLKMFN